MTKLEALILLAAAAHYVNRTAHRTMVEKMEALIREGYDLA